VDDMTTHPATSAMVREYVTGMIATLTQPAGRCATSPMAGEECIPLAFLVPTSSDEPASDGKSYAATIFLSAGISPTSAYALDCARHSRCRAEAEPVT